MDLHLTYDASLDPTRFVGRITIIEQVCGRLCNPEFLSSSIVGGPKMGKTSLLRFVASSNADKYFDKVGLIRIYFDAGLLGSQSTSNDFWRGVLREILSHPEAANFQQLIEEKVQRAIDHKLDEYDLHDVLDVFAKSGNPIALLVDNFETPLRNDKFWDASDFFHQVRTLGQRRPRGLAFVTTTPRPLLDFWRPGTSASPFYNIFLNFPLGALEKKELSEYVQQAAKALKILNEAEIDEIIEIVSEASEGHPLIANFVLSACIKRKAVGEQIDLSAISASLEDPTGPLVTLVRQIRNELSPQERQWLDSASEGQPVTRIQQERLLQLKKYGLVPPGVMA